MMNWGKTKNAAAAGAPPTAREKAAQSTSDFAIEEGTLPPLPSARLAAGHATEAAKRAQKAARPRERAASSPPPSQEEEEEEEDPREQARLALAHEDDADESTDDEIGQAPSEAPSIDLTRPLPKGSLAPIPLQGDSATRRWRGEYLYSRSYWLHELFRFSLSALVACAIVVGKLRDSFRNHLEGMSAQEVVNALIQQTAAIAVSGVFISTFVFYVVRYPFANYGKPWYEGRNVNYAVIATWFLYFWHGLMLLASVGFLIAVYALLTCSLQENCYGVGD